jgi:hypothetical protein
MGSQSPIDREAQMLLYQVTVSDLTYFKTQQWSLTNHCFLLLAAIVGTQQLLGSSIAQWERNALAGVSLSIVVAALVLLGKLQDSVVVRQARLDAAREKLGLEFYTSWAAKAKATEYVHSIWILRLAILIGGFVVIWLLVR